jgi:hypothetical protein
MQAPTIAMRSPGAVARKAGAGVEKPSTRRSTAGGSRPLILTPKRFVRERSFGKSEFKYPAPPRTSPNE